MQETLYKDSNDDLQWKELNSDLDQSWFDIHMMIDYKIMIDYMSTIDKLMTDCKIMITK